MKESSPNPPIKEEGNLKTSGMGLRSPFLTFFYCLSTRVAAKAEPHSSSMGSCRSMTALKATIVSLRANPSGCSLSWMMFSR